MAPKVNHCFSIYMEQLQWLMVLIRKVVQAKGLYLFRFVYVIN